MSTYPKFNDREFDLLKAICANTAAIADDEAGDVSSVNGRTGAVTLTSADVGLDLVENTAISTWAGSVNLTTLGTVTSGTWNGGVLAGQYGGTGVANTGKTVTLGGNLVTSGAFAVTLTLTAGTNVTLPITGTLATLAGSETLTNKTLTSAVIATGLSGTSVTLSFLSSSTITVAGGGVIGGAAGVDLGYTNVGATVASGGRFGWTAGASASAAADTYLSRNSAGVAEFNGFFRTAAPTTGTAANWKVGSNITSGTSVIDATGYVEVDIGGTLVKLARVTNS